MDMPRVTSRASALRDGFTDRELHAGWRRVRRGYYVGVDGAADRTASQQHLMLTDAAVQAASPDAIISHVSAAVVHDLDLWAAPLGRVHLLRNRATGGRVTRQLVLHSMRITPEEIVLVGDRKVTSAARTVIDLARTLPFDQAVVLGDSALRLGKTTRAELVEQLARHLGPGTPKARRVVEFVDGRSESPGESRSRVALHTARFPKPELQASIVTPDHRFVARVDFLFPELGIIGEFDGLIKYRTHLRGLRSPEDIVIAEKAREDALRALGWLVVRWTWHELTTQTWLPRLTQATHIARPLTRTGYWYPEPTDHPHGSQGLNSL
ncbi:hypothetical protein DFR70_104308 [Nocardia tenerifensis]|uniref:Transcriptional regulator, AbiEi antitoxin, Type IV TA system n=1 Tax=Nocardia tenerifensis TaxID=228006 RepID=A0A318K6U0_9NOCA|nr:hypothetical protein [Nocardia tenerifensis]PXX65246.1 hypothetical protein DFR70_104308 [Nocardia tenerifensis]